MPDVELLPKQFDFVEDPAPWCLAYGGRASTKTTGGCWKVYTRARFPGAREFLGRQKLIDLRGTTIKTLLEGDGNLPPVIPPGTYTHNQQLKTIKIHGGGEIVYNGMDQGDVGRQAGSTGKGSSMNLSGATFDEAVETNENAVLQVCMSVRLKIEGLPLQRTFMCNPGPPSHWIARRWGLSLGQKAMPGHVAYHLRPVDNYHLPPEFIEQLHQLEGVSRQRYLDGKWVGSDGLVYDYWDRDIHVMERARPGKTVRLGVDEGYNDPFVILRAEVDSDGGVDIAREHYQTGMLRDEKIAAVKEVLADDKDARVVVDNSAAELIEHMRTQGINAVPCEKGPGSILNGISLVQTRLKVQGDGQPRLRVAEGCTNTIREFETYEWKPGDSGSKDEPRDQDNHAMDALRYLIRDLDESRGVFGGAVSALSLGGAATNEDRMWTRWN